MKDLVFAAYRPAYGYGYGHVHSYGGGWSDWIAHMVLSSVIHAVIYRFVFQLMHRLTLGQAALLVVVVLAVLFMWGRSRDQRRW
jgi:uncharacterized membrane protein YagU involved in acid resistance